VAVAKQYDAAEHRQVPGAPVGPPAINQLYVLVVANMFSQILVFVSSCCNPIIYALTFFRAPIKTFISVEDSTFYFFLASSTDC